MNIKVYLLSDDECIMVSVGVVTKTLFGKEPWLHIRFQILVNCAPWEADKAA